MQQQPVLNRISAAESSEAEVDIADHQSAFVPAVPGILPADVPTAVTAGGRTAEEEKHTRSETQAGPSGRVNEAV